MGTSLRCLTGVRPELLAAISPATWYNAGLVVLLFVMAFACYWAYQVWSEVNEEEEPASTEELLASFEQARAQGDLDEAEYERVRKRIEETGDCPPGASAKKPGRRATGGKDLP
jgi:hypothetical protein